MYTAILSLAGAIIAVIGMMVYGMSAATGGLVLIIGIVLGLLVDDQLRRRAARMQGSTPPKNGNP